MAADAKRAAAVGVAALGVEVGLVALFARAGVGPLPVLLANGVLAGFALLALVDRRASLVDELGLGKPALLDIAAGLAMAGPLALALATTRVVVAAPQPFHLLRLALATALAEEIFFRGFVLHLLVGRARWRAPGAIALTAFAAAAARAAAMPSAPIAAIVETASLAAATAAWLGWLFVAWRDSLWVPLALHFGMNLAFAAFDGALVEGTGDPWGHVGRLASFALSVAVTLLVRRRFSRPPAT